MWKSLFIRELYRYALRCSTHVDDAARAYNYKDEKIKSSLILRSIILLYRTDTRLTPIRGMCVR